MASSNMYRVGDYVYFETSATAPYQIRKIEELNKTSSGAVEAKVVCYYRRRDITASLVQLADKYQSPFDVENYENGETGSNGGNGSGDGNTNNAESLSDLQKHQLKHREVFVSRQVETLPATHIRGKCNVTLWCETEALASYLEKDDSFYYTLKYDPSQKTLLADRGDIRVGQKYQAKIPPMLGEGESDNRNEKDLEDLVWRPEAELCESKVEEFVLLARSVGTMARAYEPTSAARQPNLLMSAAAASRDATTMHALELLHKADYDMSRSVSLLLPNGAPLLVRDEMEEWTASEGNLFEEAMEKYGKDFHDIRNDFLPWKTTPALVEYYYMWKTTDRYVQQKRVKAAEAEHKLKQVYIPNYNKPNPAVLYPGKLEGDTGRNSCESCMATASPQWFAWGPHNLQCRLCANCWTYWKKYGGLKQPTKIERMTAAASAMNAVGSNASGTATPNAGATSIVSGGSGSVCNNGPFHSFRCNVTGCNAEFRVKSHLVRHLTQTHGVQLKSEGTAPGMGVGIRGTAPPGAVGLSNKPRSSYYYCPSSHTRAARLVCADLVSAKRLARRPHRPGVFNSGAKAKLASGAGGAAKVPNVTGIDALTRIKSEAEERLQAQNTDPKTVVENFMKRVSQFRVRSVHGSKTCGAAANSITAKLATAKNGALMEEEPAVLRRDVEVRLKINSHLAYPPLTKEEQEAVELRLFSSPAAAPPTTPGAASENATTPVLTPSGGAASSKKRELNGDSEESGPVAKKATMENGLVMDLNTNSNRCQES